MSTRSIFSFLFSLVNMNCPHDKSVIHFHERNNVNQPNFQKQLSLHQTLYYPNTYYCIIVILNSLSKYSGVIHQDLNQ